MELKDPSVAIIATALIALSWLIGGVVSYSATAIFLLIIVLDFLRLMLGIWVMQRLKISRTVPAVNVSMGSYFVFITKLNYRGHAERHVNYVQPMDPKIRSSEPQSGEVVLSRGATVELITKLKPLQFGELTIPPLTLILESWFFKDSVKIGKDIQIKAHLGVSVPGAHSQVALRHMRHENSIIELHRDTAKDGVDFSHIRNYSPGDNMRNIDWARSSRSNKLIVREFENELTYPTFFFIDVDHTMGTGETSELNTVIKLTSLLINKLSLDNTTFGLICFSRDDIIKYIPSGMGNKHIVHTMEVLSSLTPIPSSKESMSRDTTLFEAGNLKSSLKEYKELAILSSVMDETIRSYQTSITADGFSKAVQKVINSTGSKCQFIIMTNDSMGNGILLNGIRMATYRGHHITVILTPHLWFGSDPGSAEECHEKYLKLKDTLRRVRGASNVRVIDLGNGEKPEEALYKELPKTRMDG
ncbi:MAG TPA: DUF58 domain-containing protein [Methanocella sp.]|nr:DUF58 domain-containing protein [Methanocella sp.]